MEKSIESSELSTADLRSLVESASFSEITLLNVNNSPIGTDGLVAIGQSPHTGNLRTLNASKLKAQDAGIAAIASSETLAPDSLWLRYNAFTAKGVEALAQSKVISKVKILDLGFNQVGDLGASALAQSPHLHELQTLDLTSAGIGDAGASAIMGSENLKKLRVLWLGLNELTPRAIEPLFDSGNLPALSHLIISVNAVNEADKARLEGARPDLFIELMH